MRIYRLSDRFSTAWPVVADDADGFFDLRPLTSDITPEFIGEGGLASIANALAVGALPSADVAGLAMEAPVNRPGKIICCGLNYVDHARESDMPIPAEPVLFMKASSTIVGPFSPVRIPPGSAKTDWEVELAVVMGRSTYRLPTPQDSLAHVAGYTISNDVSERHYQLERGGQWDKGKSCPTFNPLGPFLRPAGEIPDVQDLKLTTTVNGALRQSGSTRDMVFGVAYLVWYVSQFMELDPGDVINTGTPAGVAMGTAGQPYLRDGDVVEMTITGLGMQRQTFVQDR